MSYRPDHFRLEELVDPLLFRHAGERCWELLDERALQALDALRERFGPLVVNNWHSKGSSFTNQIYRESGLRRWDTKTGAARSQHELLSETVQSKFKPSLFTAATTMVSFLSLAVSGIRPVIDFGLMMTWGCLFAFVLTFLLFTVAMVHLKVNRPQPVTET